MKRSKWIEFIICFGVSLLAIICLILLAEDLKRVEGIPPMERVVQVLVMLMTLLIAATNMTKFYSYFFVWRHEQKSFERLKKWFLGACAQKWKERLFLKEEAAFDKFKCFAEEAYLDTGFFSSMGCEKRANLAELKMREYLESLESA